MLPIPIACSLNNSDILTAVQWSCKKVHYAIDRPGMNIRGISESLDDKIMGDIATFAVVRYLETVDTRAVAYDEIRQDDFQQPDPGWDIAIGPDARIWAQAPRDSRVPEGLITASVRSSRLPRNDTLEAAIRTRDFKIFAPRNTRIEDCITADLEMQVYYPYLQTQLQNRRTDLETIQQCIENMAQCEQILNDLAVALRYNECHLTAWNSRTNIVSYSKQLSSPHWESFGKRMWIAPLRFGNSFGTFFNL